MSLILSFISSSLHITGYLEIYHKLFIIKALTSVKFVVVHHHPPGGLTEQDEQGPNPMCHVQHRSRGHSEWMGWDGVMTCPKFQKKSPKSFSKNRLLQWKTYLLQDESHELQSQD